MRRSPRLPGLDATILVPIGLVAFTGLLVAHAAWHGALGAARNDDWAYLRVAERFARDGEFRLDGWTQMTFVGQAVLAWPAARLFGTSIETLQLLVAGLGVVGVVALWWTVRLWLPQRSAVVVVGLVVAGPLYAPLAVSFMTDVPAFAATSVCLLGAAQIANRFSAGRLAVICASGLAAVSIREYGLVPLVVGLATALVVAPPAVRRWVAVVSAATALGAIAVIAWRRTIEHGGPSTGIEGGFDAIVAGGDQFARGLLTMGLLISPVAVAAAARRLRRRAQGTDGLSAGPALAGIVVSAALLWRADLRFVGNYLGRRSYTLVEGTRPEVLPGWLDTAAKAVAAVSLLGVSFVASGWVARTAGRPRSLGAFRWVCPRGVVAVTLGATLGVHAALCLATDAPFFDRYLLGPAAWASALLLDDSSAARVGRLDGRSAERFAACACAAVLLLVSVRLANSSAALDGGAWRAAERASVSVAPARVDGGFAWFNYHQDGPVHAGWVAGRNWWTSFYPDREVCATVAVAAASGDSSPAVRSALGPSYEFDVTYSGTAACRAS